MRSPVRILLSLCAALALVTFTVGAVSATPPREDQPTPIARGPRISGVVQSMAHRPSSAAPAAATGVSCTSGGTNLKTDCASSGRPVNETSIATAPDNSLIVAGANDYNSYNGQGQNGFYWSTDGTSWNDAGPIDVFPHNNNNGAGDPGLAVDSSGVVYYSSLFFNFYRCNVGGVELLRRDTNGTWSYYQIASNSSAQFQDKPAITVSGSNVFVSWTQFGSCSGVNVTSPIRVAVLPTGASSVAPTTILTVPGSTYAQGSSIQADGSGGFWIAWEEWASATAKNGSIKIAHWNGGNWNTPQTISPGGFKDLPSPLSGFKFRDNSFPALAVVNGQPWVTWTSADSGKGRAYLWNGSGAAQAIANSGGDQFFPAIAFDGGTGAYVSYSQVTGTGVYDTYLWDGSSASKVSTKSSNPSQDAFFGGQFIGDYNGMTVANGVPMPIWTDIRGSNPNYPGWEMDSMTLPGSTTGGGGGGTGGTTTAPGSPNLSAQAGNAEVTLNWSVPSSGGSTITGYNVYRSTDGSSFGLYATPGDVTSYNDTGVTNGSTYWYYVTAVNGAGEGSASNTVSETPTAPTGTTVPGAPQNLVAQPAKGKGIQLTWDVPSSGASAVAGYNVYRSTGGSSFTLYATPGNVTSYKDPHTSRGQTYSYYVTAVNGSGTEGSASNTASATAT